MPAKFEVFRRQAMVWNSPGTRKMPVIRWYFHLKGENHEIILASEAYTSKAKALKTVKRIKSLAADAPVVVLWWLK